MSVFVESLYFVLDDAGFYVTDGQLDCYVYDCDVGQLRRALAGTVERARSEGYESGRGL